jgi:hypothetical protein
LSIPRLPNKGQPLPPDSSKPTLEDKVRKEILAACQPANGKLGGMRRGRELGLKRTTFLQDEAVRNHATLGQFAGLNAHD